MSDKSNNQGRGYEYIFLISLYHAIREIRPVELLRNSSYEAAERAWQSLSQPQQALYALSSRSTIETLFALEPNMIEPTADVLQLYIQADNKGEEADVRDVVIARKNIIWEVGVNLKHNHRAVKHSRLGRGLYFGQRWYGIPCSSEYWTEVKPLFDFLEKCKEEGLYFRDMASKEDMVYVPLLNAFIKEVEKQVKHCPSVPHRLVAYLLSRYDFYKVVSIDRQRITTIQSFNMFGTLNRPSHTKKPDLHVPITDLPSSLLYIGFKPNSKTTVLLCFDNGWQFSFRLHNAKDLVEPSLKFDIQLIGIPAIVDVKFNCKWDET